MAKTEKKVEICSPEEADRRTRAAYRAMTPQQRLAVQAELIRQVYGDNPPRLERILTIAKLPRED